MLTATKPRALTDARSARIAENALFASLIGSDELRVFEDVPFPRLQQRGLGGRAQVAQYRIQREQLEEVAVPADRRTGTAVASLAPVVFSVARASRRLAALRKRRCRRGNVIEQPVDVRALRRFRIRRVGIVDDEGEAFRSGGS